MGELHIASTTDTQEAMNEALGIGDDEKPDVVAAEADGEKPEGEPEKEPPKAEKEAAEAEKPGKSAVQKRIDQITKEKYQERREKEEEKRLRLELEERVKQLEERQTKKSEPEAKPEAEELPAPQPEPEGLRPKPTKFDLNPDGTPKYSAEEEFLEDLTDWKIEKHEYERLQNEMKAAQEAESRRIANAYNKEAAEFKKEHPDFDEVLSRPMKLPTLVRDAIIEQASPATAYYLANHPELSDDLMANINNPRYLLVRIGEIKAMATTRSEIVPQDEDEVEVDRSMPKPRVASRAPAPIKPLSGSPTKSSLPLDEMNYQEYRRIRDRQEKERYRR